MNSSPIFMSEQEYLVAERIAEHKSEYHNGSVVAAGFESRNHHAIVASLIGTLYPIIKKKIGNIYSCDMRVYNPAEHCFFYPDALIVFDTEKCFDHKLDTLLNPTVIFEVLSPSTENYDRGTKFKLYRSIPSLQNYVMISSTEYLAEVYTRREDAWVLTTAKGKEASLFISSINFAMELSDMYAQIEQFSSEGNAPLK